MMGRANTEAHGKARAVLCAALTFVLAFSMTPAFALGASDAGGSEQELTEQAGSSAPADDAEGAGESDSGDGAVAGDPGPNPSGIVPNDAGADADSEAALPGDADAANAADTDSAEPATARTSGPRKVVRPVQPTHTYVYHDGGKVVETLILKDGDTVTAPASPNRAGKRFDGWCEDEALARLFAGFGGEAAGDGGTTHLYAKFTDVHYFTYYDESGKVIECELVELGQSYTFYAQSPQFTLASDTARNDGWRAADGTMYGEADAYPGGQTITVSGDLDLRPVPQEGFYAHFHSQGGSATVSQFIHEGGKVARPADPTRQGYAFAGWYDAPEGGNAFDFDAAPAMPADGALELYVHWTPAEADYTLLFYVQDADNPEEYAYRNGYIKHGVTGSMSTLSPDDRKFAGFPIEDVDSYFVNEQKTKMRQIQGDGSTVVEVYCDCVWYNIQLADGTTVVMRAGESVPAALKGTSLYEGINYNYHDLLFADSYCKLSLTKNGSEFSSLYLNDCAFQNAYVLTNAARARVNFGADKSIEPGTTLYASEPIRLIDASGNYEFLIDLYYEDLSSSSNSIVWSAPERVVGYRKDTSCAYTDKSDERFALQKVEGGNSASSGGYKFVFPSGSKTSNVMSVYYERKRYDITYVVNGGVSVPNKTGVFYDLPLADAAPAGYKVGETTLSKNGTLYVFSGWYEDVSTSVKPFVFDDTARMPAHNLTLYAGWQEVTHTITYDPMGGTMEDDLTQTVRYGQRLEESAEPVRHGYRFVDWHLVDGSDPDDMGQPYVFGSPVNDDMTLRAHWVSDTAHTIVYKPGEGSGSVPSIGTYLPGSTGRAQSGDALVPPAGKHFSYWLSADGVRYYPGELVPVENSDIVLTAQYSPAELVGLAYDLNYSRFGIAAPVPDQVVAGASGLLVNSTVRLRDPAASEIPDGWKFAGWYLDAGCTGDSVTEVMVDADAPLPNVVYAKWVRDAAPGEAGADPNPAPNRTRPAAASPQTGDDLPTATLAVLALCSLALALIARPRATQPRGRHIRR